jgi:CheY-like chemotaxis protein
MTALAGAHPVEHLVRDLRMLVIDDEPAALKVVQGMLFGLGVRSVLATSNASKALGVFLTGEAGVLDLVLCDWRMPGVSGLEFLQQVRLVRPDLPFIMVTGTADAASVIAAKDSGVTSYIKKPFSADELGRKLVTVARIKAHRAASPPTRRRPH